MAVAAAPTAPAAEVAISSRRRSFFRVSDMFCVSGMGCAQCAEEKRSGAGGVHRAVATGGYDRRGGTILVATTTRLRFCESSKQRPCQSVKAQRSGGFPAKGRRCLTAKTAIQGSDWHSTARLTPDRSQARRCARPSPGSATVSQIGSDSGSMTAMLTATSTASVSDCRTDVFDLPQKTNVPIALARHLLMDNQTTGAPS